MRFCVFAVLSFLANCGELVGLHSPSNLNLWWREADSMSMRLQSN